MHTRISSVIGLSVGLACTVHAGAQNAAPQAVPAEQTGGRGHSAELPAASLLLGPREPRGDVHEPRHAGHPAPAARAVRHAPAPHG